MSNQCFSTFANSCPRHFQRTTYVSPFIEPNEIDQVIAPFFKYMPITWINVMMLYDDEPPIHKQTDSLKRYLYKNGFTGYVEGPEPEMWRNEQYKGELE